MELKYYLDILFRRRRLFLIVTAALTLLPLALTLFRDPVYQATARTILFKRDMKLLLSSSLPDEFSSYSYLDSDYVQDNLVEIIKSPATLRRVADKCDLEGDPKEIYSSLPFLQSLFRGAKPLVKVEHLSDTDIFEFQGYGSTMEKAERMAGAYLAAFGELWNQMYQDAIARLESGIIARQADLSKELAEVFNKERALKKKVGVGDFSQAIQKEYDQLSTLETSLNGVITSNQLLDTQQREIKKRLNKLPKFRTASESLEISPVITEAKSKLANLLWSLSGMRMTITDAHVDIKATLAQIEAAKQTIRDEAVKTFKNESNEVDPYYDELVKRYSENEISRYVDGYREKILKAQIGKQQSVLVGLSSQMLDLSPVSKENDTLMNALANNIKALDSIKLLKKVDVSHMMRINHAAREFENGKPYFPRRTLLFMFSLFAGVTLAFIVVLVSEYLDSTIKTSLELEQITGRPVFHSLAQGQPRAKTEAGSAPPPASTEMANLAQALMLARREGTLTSAGVVSVEDGEGKTTVALGLASLLSQEGGRVLLLDLDPASSQYSAPGGGPREKDAARPAGGEAPLTDRVRPLAPGLDLLALGRLSPLEAARLHPRLLAFLEQARQEASYEFLLLDLPALGRSASVLKYLDQAEVVLFVVGLGLTDAYQASKWFNQLARESDGRSLLLLANRERLARGWRDWLTGLVPGKRAKSV